jgi:hypothetical protein
MRSSLPHRIVAMIDFNHAGSSSLVGRYRDDFDPEIRLGACGVPGSDVDDECRRLTDPVPRKRASVGG